MSKICRTNNSRTSILIRLMVAAVFLSEGIQKFLFPEPRGAGRFEKIGLQEQDVLGYIEISASIEISFLIS